MGDTDAAPSTENVTESPPQTGACDIPKPSIDILKEAKPSENIAISEPITDKTESSPVINIEATLKASSTLDDDKKTVDELKNDAKVVLDNDDAAIKLKEKASLKNRSDIFSLNENKNPTSTIFSVGGAPSKTIHSNSTSSHETISSGTSSQLRNPVTGFGVSSNDEFKTKPSKRRDGNPLLGVGYKDDDHNAPTGQRIPPGGYSKGLW